MDIGTSWVIVVGVIAGCTLLSPIARGFGRYLTALAEGRRKDPPAPASPALQAELDRTRDELERTRNDLERLAERQEFLEALVTEKAVPAIGAGAQDAAV